MACGYYPKGPGITGTLSHLTGFKVLSPLLSLFNNPERDRQDRPFYSHFTGGETETGQGGVTCRGHTASERLGTRSPDS